MPNEHFEDLISNASSNSHTKNPPKPKTELKNFSGVEIKKQSVLDIVIGGIIKGDPNEVIKNLVTEWLGPYARNGLYEFVTNFARGVFLDDRTVKTNTRKGTPSSSSSGAYWRSSSDFDGEGKRSSVPSVSRTQPRFRDVSFTSREAAEEAIEDMDALIQARGYVTAREFFEHAGVSSDYSLDNWGWKTSVGIEVKVHPDGGYYLSFPKMVQVR